MKAIITRFTTNLLLFSFGVANACKGFEATCRCPSENGGLQLLYAPETTLHVQRGEYSCQAATGRCELNHCAPSHFHRCPPCNSPAVITRPLDTPGWISRWDVWSEFIAADGQDDSCLTDALGINEDGFAVYGTVIVPANGSVETSLQYQTSRWMPTGSNDYLEHPIEMLEIKC